jgi:hypothetical protein
LTAAAAAAAAAAVVAVAAAAELEDTSLAPHVFDVNVPAARKPSPCHLHVLALAVNK